MLKKFILSLFIVFLSSSCTEKEPSGTILEQALASQDPNIKRVIDNVEQFEVQIRYTQIDRNNDSIAFTDYDFQVDENNYFYPASTVKFPAAVLALEKLNSIDTLNKDTKFYIEGDSVETTFAKAISEIFAVSDNIANNRLVEFLGQDAMNEALKKRGVEPVRIAHRLGYHSDDVATKPLIIYINDSTTAIFEGTVNTSPKPLELQGIKKGKGFSSSSIIAISYRIIRYTRIIIIWIASCWCSIHIYIYRIIRIFLAGPDVYIFIYLIVF